MAAVLAVEPKTCPGCSCEFVDPTEYQSRTYCLTCRPPKGQAPRPKVLPFEREIPSDAFTVPHFREWSSQFKLKSGEQFELELYQERFLEDLFARHPDGRPVFQELWLILPEGNGKTTFISLVVLYTIEFSPEAWVPVAASSRDQGVDLTYRIASGFVKRNRLDHEHGGAYRLHPGYRQIVHQGSLGTAKIFASDEASGDGVDPTLALIEELHRLVSMGLYRTWAGKLEKSDGQLVVVSTAGDPTGEFEELRRDMRRAGTDVTRDGCYLRAAGPTTVIHEYAIPEKADPEDLQIVLAANPFSGVTLESLKRKREKPYWELAHWRRFTCNVPTRDGNPAVGEIEWHKAESDEEIPDGAEIWAGLDLGWKHDTTAWVPFWPRDFDFRLIGKATILEPPRNGTMLDVDLVKRAITETAERWSLRAVVMDQSYGADLAQWLLDQGIDVIDRAQSNAFAVQDHERFMEGLRAGWLRKQPDPAMTEHVLNAVARILPGGEIRFDRPKEARNTKQQRRRVIDGLSAASGVNAVVWAEFADGESDGVVF